MKNLTCLIITLLMAGCLTPVSNVQEFDMAKLREFDRTTLCIDYYLFRSGNEIAINGSPWNKPEG